MSLKARIRKMAEDKNVSAQAVLQIYLMHDKQILKEAFNATANHRGSKDKIVRYDTILDDVLSNREMTERWEVYSETNPYASGISFKEVVDAVRLLSEIC